MALTLSVAASGTGPLVRATVAPFVRENVAARGSIVQVAASGVERVCTNARLRMAHLLVPDSTTARVYRSAAQDTAGLWSEWGPPITLSASNFSAGSTDVSIGSASTSAQDIEEPGVLFPDLSFGTGIVEMHRTLVGEGFADEIRRPMWENGLAVIQVVLEDLDADQIELLHAFYRDLNGPFKLFYFDWIDPMGGGETRYIVRFREDPTEDLNVVDRSDFNLVLAEVPRAAGGGDV